VHEKRQVVEVVLEEIGIFWSQRTDPEQLPLHGNECDLMLVEISRRTRRLIMISEWIRDAAEVLTLSSEWLKVLLRQKAGAR